MAENKNLTYQQARRLRGTGLGKIFADQLEQSESVGGALKRTASLKMQAEMKGIKEKFDPLNIARFMTMGSSWAPALLGHMTGRSHDDTRYFSGRLKPIVVKDRSKKITPLPKDGEQLVEGRNIRVKGLNEQLLKIYKVLDKSMQSETKRREMEHNFDEERAQEAERRHKEFLKVLMAVTGYQGDPTAIQIQPTDTGGGFTDMEKFLMFMEGLQWLSKWRTLASFFAEGIVPLMLGAFPMLALWKVADWAEKADINNPDGNPIAETAKKGLEFSQWYDNVTGRSDKLKQEQMDRNDKRMREGDPWENKNAKSDAEQLKALAPVIQNYEQKYRDAKAEEKQQVATALNAIYDQRDALIKKIGGVDAPGERITGPTATKKTETKTKAVTAGESAGPSASKVETKTASSPATATPASTTNNTDVKNTNVSNVSTTGGDTTTISTAEAKAQPVPSPAPQTQKLNAAMAENAEVTLPKVVAEKNVTVNNMVSQTKKENRPVDRLSELAVRNDEPTLLRMMMASSKFV